MRVRLRLLPWHKKALKNARLWRKDYNAAMVSYGALKHRADDYDCLCSDRPQKWLVNNPEYRELSAAESRKAIHIREAEIARESTPTWIDVATKGYWDWTKKVENNVPISQVFLDDYEMPAPEDPAIPAVFGNTDWPSFLINPNQMPQPPSPPPPPSFSVDVAMSPPSQVAPPSSLLSLPDYEEDASEVLPAVQSATQSAEPSIFMTAETLDQRLYDFETEFAQALESMLKLEAWKAEEILEQFRVDFLAEINSMFPGYSDWDLEPDDEPMLLLRPNFSTHRLIDLVREASKQYFEAAIEERVEAGKRARVKESMEAKSAFDTYMEAAVKSIGAADPSVEKAEDDEEEEEW